MQIKGSLKKADYMNEFKVRFISMTSHQINTPLSNIKISMELCKMLLNDNLSLADVKRISDLLTDVINDTDRISNLLSDILNVIITEDFKIPYHPVFISVNSFIKDYLLKEGRKITGDRKVDLILFPDDAVVFIDLKLMHQVIENILGNAIKYSPGNSTVEIVTKKVSGKISVEINDSGIGIPEEDIPFLFQQFFRSENVGQVSGTGIGLSIVKTYLEMNKGSVEVESRPNEGTSFKIYLPEFLPKS